MPRLQFLRQVGAGKTCFRDCCCTIGQYELQTRRHCSKIEEGLNLQQTAGIATQNQPLGIVGNVCRDNFANLGTRIHQRGI